ncbi:SDR family oxidoreductase [Pseudonocardia kujensis]|uniref:SDR family oxidoreductase n=1 Tax=Pseudonocardia kujensis TaxID=1128675 RepID=UPI001E363204|nr:SDR family oxidoreductase [Pseudonocardia kujensis]MCE0761506.1 SDR family oxidoreductase [Pseudonocardia kujensis]
MTTYAVTGATGHLGALAIEALLEKGVPAGDVVAVVRDPGKAAALTARGVQVRVGDYGQPETLRTALAGVDRLLLVSGSEVGKRVEQHGNVIDAAKEAGVALIAYTSITRADSTGSPLAPEHRATEELLAASGVPHTLLRNNWYVENYTAQLTDYLSRGAIVAAAGEGRVAMAARRDYAEAAAVVLTGEGHAGKTYELAGAPVTFKGLAATITEVSGREVEYRPVSATELAGILTGAGLDEGTAGFVVALDESIARGDLDIDSSDLAELLGRPLTPVADVVRAAL